MNRIDHFPPNRRGHSLLTWTKWGQCCTRHLEFQISFLRTLFLTVTTMEIYFPYHFSGAISLSSARNWTGRTAGDINWWVGVGRTVETKR